MKPPNGRKDAERSILQDPIFLVVVGVFALLTTVVGVFVGSPLFLTLLQTAALWILALAAFRGRSVRAALLILTLWSVLQFLGLAALGLVTANRVESAVGDGFLYHEALLEWIYTGSALPASWRSQPAARLGELLAVTVGSMVSAGLAGIWSLVRMVNLYAFSLVTLVQTTSTPAGIAGGLAPWMLLRIAGSILSISVLSLVLFTGEWWPGRWPRSHRQFLWLALGLLGASILLELLLPPYWPAIFGTT